MNARDRSAGQPAVEFGLHGKRSFFIIGLFGLALVMAGLLMARVEMTSDSVGVVRANSEYYVFSPADGRVSDHRARIGFTVEEGDILLAIDDWPLRMEITRKEGEMARVNAMLDINDLNLRKAEIRTLEPDILTAEDRVRLLDEIRRIQEDITDSLRRLDDDRAIRSLELHRQRVDNLRTDLESLTGRVLQEWGQAGLEDLEKEALQLERKRLERERRQHETELELLKERREELLVRAPISGEIVDVYTRYEGMTVSRGDRLLKIIGSESPMSVRTYIPQRNIDLIREGMRVRMESHVFDSTLDGYVYGQISRLVKEAAPFSENEDPLYEVVVDITDTPYPLVLGSTVKVSVLLGQRSLFQALLGRSATPRSEDKNHEQSI